MKGTGEDEKGKKMCFSWQGRSGEIKCKDCVVGGLILFPLFHLPVSLCLEFFLFIAAFWRRKRNRGLLSGSAVSRARQLPG